MRLEGKVALITGAAAAAPGELMGFGGAAAWAFAREGASVMLADINDAAGERGAAALVEAGFNARYLHLDVTSADQWEVAVSTTVAEFGAIDVLVNNAGTSARFTVEETSEELWDQQMDVHAKGVFLGTRAVLPAMRNAGGGSIINVSSIYGIVGSPSATAYHAAKGAIRTFTKAAAVQYAPEHIRVNSLHPGFAVTPLTNDLFEKPQVSQWLLDRIPMGRLGTAEDLVPGIVFLASDESRYMTGAELVIDGGVTAQ